MRNADIVIAIVVALICAWIGLEVATRYLEWRPIVGNPSWGGTLDGRAFRGLLGEGMLAIAVFIAIIMPWVILLMRGGARGPILVLPWIVVVAVPLVLLAIIPMELLVVMYFWPFLMASAIAGTLFWIAFLLLSRPAD